MDQEEINIPIHPTNDNDHNHDDPHDDQKSDDTQSDEQDKSPSDKDNSDTGSSYTTASDSDSDSDSEKEEVKQELQKESEEEESKSESSRGGSFNSSNEKSNKGSNHGDETKPGSESDSEDPFREPGPSQPLRRSSRVPKPRYPFGNIYGMKPAAQIEQEIKSDKAWQKAIDPDAKIAIKHAHENIKDDLSKIIKEGGNKSIHFLLAQAVDIEKDRKSTRLNSSHRR